MPWNDYPAVALAIVDCLDQCSPPQINSPLEALIVTAHVSMALSGFTLISLSRDGNRRKECEAVKPSNMLPSTWNSTPSPAFIFNYALASAEGDNVEYVEIAVVRLGTTKAYIAGTKSGAIVDQEEVETEEKSASVEITMKDWFSPDAFPLSINQDTDDDGDGEGFSDPASQATIATMFSSPNGLLKLTDSIKSDIIDVLFPNLKTLRSCQASADTKGPPHPDADSRATATRSSDLRLPPQPPAPTRQPRPGPGEERTIPGFDDEFELQPDAYRPRIPTTTGMTVPHPQPPPLGSRDIHPPGFGPNDPLRRIHDPYAPGAPGGGMHPTFDDSIFNPQGPLPDQSFQESYPAPPGARFDPPAPFGNPRDFQPGRFPGGGSGGASGTGNSPFGFGGGI